MPTRIVNQTAMYYEEAGSGSPLVLLHGFPLDGRIWQEQLAGLSDRFRVIAPDLRGFGKSELGEGFTIESLADDVELLLRQLHAVPCVVGGLSMGGYVALAYAGKYQSHLKGLILMDTKAAGDTPEQKQGRDKIIELVRASGAKALAEQMMPRLLDANTESRRPEVVDRLRRIMQSCAPSTIEAALRAMRDRSDSTPRLGSISVPVLIVVGQNDVTTPPSVAEEMHGQIPHGRLVKIPDAGHLTPMEQPEHVNRAIGEFLNSLQL